MDIGAEIDRLERRLNITFTSANRKELIRIITSSLAGDNKDPHDLNKLTVAELRAMFKERQIDRWNDAPVSKLKKAELIDAINAHKPRSSSPKRRSESRVCPLTNTSLRCGKSLPKYDGNVLTQENIDRIKFSDKALLTYANGVRIYKGIIPERNSPGDATYLLITGSTDVISKRSICLRNALATGKFPYTQHVLAHWDCDKGETRNIIAQGPVHGTVPLDYFLEHRAKDASDDDLVDTVCSAVGVLLALCLGYHHTYPGMGLGDLWVHDSFVFLADVTAAESTDDPVNSLIQLYDAVVGKMLRGFRRMDREDVYKAIPRNIGTFIAKEQKNGDLDSDDLASAYRDLVRDKYNK